MGKGSARRPQEVDQDEMEERWKAVFSKPKCPDCGCKKAEYRFKYDQYECPECGHKFDKE